MLLGGNDGEMNASGMWERVGITPPYRRDKRRMVITRNILAQRQEIGNR
jgi:hypothetical protein